MNRLTVLISGDGTNLQALIDACNNFKIPNTQIVRVISNRRDAYGLKRAENAGISTQYHNLLKYKKEHPQEDTTIARQGYDKILAELVLKDKPSLVVCAGFKWVLSSEFLDPLQAMGVPIINLHPALPGAFSGTNAIDRAYHAFQRREITKTGVMIHHVIPEVDMGTPILVREIDMREGESLDELEQRIHPVEWEAIVTATIMAIDELQQSKAAGI